MSAQKVGGSGGGYTAVKGNQGDRRVRIKFVDMKEFLPYERARARSQKMIKIRKNHPTRTSSRRGRFVWLLEINWPGFLCF